MQITGQASNGEGDLGGGGSAGGSGVKGGGGLGRVVDQVRPFLDRDGSRLELGRLRLRSGDIVVVGEGNND